MLERRTLWPVASSKRRSAVALLALSFGAGAKAQTVSAPGISPLSANDRVVPAARTNARILPAESLGADDLLELSVSYCPELTRDFRVSSDGSLSLPLLHERLLVAGLTPVQVEHALSQALTREGILAQPTVIVSVREYRSRKVNVAGAVNHPLTFQATGQTTLLDAISEAGGLAPGAGSTLIVSSKSGAGDEAQSADRVVSIKDLLSGSDPQVNLKLQGGEDIRVPEASKIFVAGNVRHPGMYPMLSESETTVVKAITLSEGLDSYSSATAFIYRRHGAGSDRDELKIPLNRIMTHKDPDIALMADDILYIPGSDGKRLTSRILSQLAGFGQTAGAGILIYK